MYSPVRPTFLGRKIIDSIDVFSVVPLIDWSYFFHAWRVTGDFKGLETLCDCPACKTQWLLRYRPEEQEKAKEAYQLMHDAQEVIRRGIKEGIFSLSAMVYFCEAKATEDSILLTDESGTTSFPMLRQQHVSERNDCCLSMVDFISPEKDYIGLFAVTVHGGDEWAERVKAEGDDYTSLLIKSVADRLAEATAEWLHEKIRTEYWGYANTTQAKGIRPAFGYPALPDISLLREADQLIHLGDIGITLTENCAMRPNASICGLHIAHPQAFYFIVGAIADDQKRAYAKKRGMSLEELGKWLSLSSK